MKVKNIVLALGAALGAGSSMAGGLYLYEIGTEDVGLANAGIAARAQDASVIAFNPAGMTRLSGDQLTMGAQAHYGDIKYRLDGSGALHGNDPGTVVGWFPGLSGFYSHSIADRLKVGLALYGNFGSGLKFGDWAGSALVKDVTLLGMSMFPSVAYKLDDQWSIGGGLGINYGYFSLKRDALGGGENEQNDGDWAFNGRLGLMYEPSTSTRFGIAYTSETKYNFDVSANVTLSYTIPSPIPGRPGITLTKDFVVPVSAQVNTPQQVMFSAFHQVNPQWAVMANLGWQDWSAYSDSQIWLANRQLPSEPRLQDTWGTAFGVQYQASEALRLNGGVGFDTSFYKSQDNTALTMPSGDVWHLGFGAQYQLDKASSIGGAFEFVRSDGQQVPSELVSGSYDTGKIYFFSANYSRRF